MPSSIHEKFRKIKPRSLRRTMKGIGREPRQLPKLKDEKRINQPLDIVDEKTRQTERVLGDLTQAKRVIKLQEEFPRGTLPELVAMDWLNSRHHHYFYQVEVLGGRRAGGLVPDFVLPKGGEALAILVQGTYWHEGFENVQKTQTAVERLKGSIVFGQRISEVVEVWDRKLFEDRDRVMGLAVVGIGVGR